MSTPTGRLFVIPTYFSSDDAPEPAGPDWLAAHREAARTTLASMEAPSTAEEVWRYSRIDDLDLTSFHLSSSVAGDQPTSDLATVLDAVGERSVLLATSNGRLIRSDIDDALSSKGLVAGGTDVWRDGRAYNSVAKPVDLFGHLNTAYGADPLFIDVPAGLYVEAPIVVVHWLTDVDSAVFPHLTIRAGEASEFTVIEYIASADGRLLVAPVTEVDLGPAANVRYVNVQDLSDAAWQVGYQASRLANDSTLTSTSVALGGSYARVRTDSRLQGRGGTAKLQALYFGSANQMHDFRTLQAHDVGKSTSDLLFKGAVGDTARSVYSGLIRVRKGAGGTNAFQTNRNLVLSDGAHADSVPNLEIEENDVKCSHASAVGPVDEEQRYYLESRGVPAHVADRLIVLGFLDEILNQLPGQALRWLLRKKVVAKLDRLDESKSLLA